MSPKDSYNDCKRSPEGSGVLGHKSFNPIGNIDNSSGFGYIGYGQGRDELGFPGRTDAAGTGLIPKE
jgi:hypothetical protein